MTRAERTANRNRYAPKEPALFRVVVIGGEVTATMQKGAAYARRADWLKGKYKGCEIRIEEI